MNWQTYQKKDCVMQLKRKKILRDQNQCTGCMACYNSCLFHAIEMQKDRHGVLLPVIDSQKCKNCGACERVCPQIHTVSLNKADKSFAVWSKKITDLKYSSSGGAAAVFSRRAFIQGG